MSTAFTARDIHTRGDIEALVGDFYACVRGDAMLGGFFARHVAGDWAGHEKRVCDFWESVLLGTPCFKSRALLGHGPVDEACPLCPAHFERWCVLFEEALERRFEGRRAERARERARAMSEALQQLIQRERGKRACPLAMPRP